MNRLVRFFLLSLLLVCAGISRSYGSQVVFSEVMYNPVGTKPEYIEVWNITNTPLDMARWEFTEGITFQFPDFDSANAQAHFLKPNERILISSSTASATRTAYPGIPVGVRIFGPWAATSTLDNGGERITLKDKNGVIMCSVSYKDDGKWSIAPDGTGHSLVLADENQDPDDWRVWRASTLNGGSPGVADPTPFTVVAQLNELSFNPSDGKVQWVEVRNPTAVSQALTGFALASALDLSNKVPLGGTLDSGAVLSFPVSFAPDANGDVRVYLVDSANNIRDAVKIRRSPGREFWQVYPAGSNEWYNGTTGTQDLPNDPARNTAIVINEIMADPPSGQTDGEYIELYNRGATPVDVGGWQLSDAVDYTFPAGTTIQPDGYLVVSANSTYFSATYGGVPVLGNWSGKLGNSGDRIRLKDANGNLVNQVDYRFGGEWPELAGGSGSSLELINPGADNSMGSAWADSDESTKSTFQTFTIDPGTTYSDVTQNGVNDDEIRVWLVGDSHIVMRNVVFKQKNGSGNLFVNGGVTTLNNNNVEGWQARGSHWATYHDAEGVHIVADASGDNKCNHAEKDASGMVVGSQYTMTFEARWVWGAPRVVVQSWDMSWGGTALLPIPANLGTPGARNSKYKANLAPQVSILKQSPAIPTTAQTVTITARVSANAPLASVQLFHRNDTVTYDGVWTSATMVDDGTGGDAIKSDGIYTAQIPLSTFGYNVAGKTVEYYVKATSVNGESSYLPRGSVVAEPLSTSQLKTGIFVVDNQTVQTDLRRMRIVMSNYWLDALNNPAPPTTSPLGQGTPSSGGGSSKFNYKFPRFSNHAFPCVFVHNDSEIYYGSGVHKTGSPFTRERDNLLTRGRVTLPGDRPFRKHKSMYWDNDGAGGTMLHNRIHRYYLYLFGVPGNENEVCRVTRNNTTYTARETSEVFDKDMLNRIWENGSDGRFTEIDDKFWMGDDGDTRLANSDGSWDYGPPNSPGPDNPVSYHNNFVPKSREIEYDYGPLIEWCRQLELNGNSINQTSLSRMGDIEAMAAYAAVRGYSADWDNITMSRGKNGFFYNRSTDKKWMLIHWDSDNAFQSNHINDAVVGSLTNVSAFYNRPYVRRALNYYFAELLGNYAPNAPRMIAWLTAEENASISYGVPSTYVSWPTTTSSSGQTRPQIIQAFIGNGLTANFATTSPANGASVESEVITVNGTAPMRAYRVICVGHPEGVQTFPSASISDLSPWSISGIQLRSGVNTLTFRMVDISGNQVGTDITLSITKTNGAIPIINIVSDPASQNVGLGEVLTVDANSSVDPDGTPLTFNWSIAPNAGYAMTSPTPGSRSFAFNSPGTYTVTVQVTDADGQTASASRVYSVHNTKDFDNFNGGFQNAFTATNTEALDNYSPDSWYSFQEQSGSLVLQITDSKTFPIRSGPPIFPTLTRALPASTDFSMQTQLQLQGRQFGNFVTGLYAVTNESGVTTRYVFGIDNGNLLRAWKSSADGTWTQVNSAVFNASEVIIRINRTGSLLNFQVKLNNTWNNVAFVSMPAGSTMVTGGVFGASGVVNSTQLSPGQSLRVAFDYLLVSDVVSGSDFLNSLRITELMYNPAGASGVEYVELQNVGTTSLNLQGAYFEAGTPFNDRFTFGALTLQPGQFCVVTNDQAGFIAKYGSNITIAGQYTGALSNDGERIVLKDPQGNTIHDFTYDDVAPWPTLADGAGPSMEVVSTNPILYGNGTNWRASLELSGSPGYLGLGIDSDGDGQADSFELAFGSNPADASSVALLPSPERGPGNVGIVIKWPSQIGRKYTVEYRDDYQTSVWTPLANVTATTTTSQYVDSTVTAGQRFYRIKVQFPQ